MIKGLNGINDLSPAARERFRQQQIQAGVINRRTPWGQIDRLYRNQAYINKFGLESFESTPWQQRDAVWKQSVILDEINKLNPYEQSNPVSEHFNKKGPLITFDDFNKVSNELQAQTYVFNPEKGVGDASVWEKLYTMANAGDYDSLEEFLNSGYKTKAQLEAEIKKDKEQRDQARALASRYDDIDRSVPYETTNALLGVDEGIAKAFRDKNQAIFDNVYSKFLSKQDKLSEKEQEARFNDIIKLGESNVKNQFLARIRRDNPSFARYYDENGNITDDIMKDFGLEDMARYLAKADVLESKLGYEAARERMTNIADEYAEEHQGWGTRQLLHTKEFAIKAGSYAAARISALAQNVADIRSATGEKNLAWVDNSGNIIDGSKIHFEDEDARTYGQPYYINGEGEKVPVHTGEFSPSDMHYQGFTANGVKLPWFLNSKSWNDAERFNISPWNEKALERANIIGASDSQVVYADGEGPNWFTQTVQMGSFMLVDGLLSLLSGSYVPAMVAQGIMSANAIGYQYGTGVYAENLQKNLSDLEENTVTDIRDNTSREEIIEAFNNRYNNDKDFRKAYNDFISAKVDELKAKDTDKRAVLVDGRTKYVNNKEDSYYKKLAEEEAMSNFSSSYLQSKIDNTKNSDWYQSAMEEAHESAALGAAVSHITDAAKYSIVNTIGYRKYLFQNPKQLAKTVGEKFKNRLTEIKTAKGPRLKYDAALKGLKDDAREVGKLALTQFKGGAWTNFTDEMQSEGGRAINEDRFAAYLNGEYDGEGNFDTYNPMISYLDGASRALYKESTWMAGLVGGLGSMLPMLNFGGIGRLTFDSKAREEFKNGDNLTRANMLITNGILNEYNALRMSEANIKNAVSTINNLLDRTNNFEDLIDSMSLDIANADATNETDKTITSFLKAIDAVHLLNTIDLTPTENNTLGQVANQSAIMDQVKSALDEIVKIKNGDATLEEEEEYLKEWYAKNPSIAKSRENDLLALQQMAVNANALAEAFTTYEEISNKIDAEEKNLETPLHPIIKKRLIQRVALDGLLEKRMTENSEIIGDGGVISATEDTGISPLTFGDKSARRTAIRSAENTLKTLEKEIESQNKEISDLESSYESQLKTLQEKAKPTEQDLIDIAKAEARIEDAKLQLEYLNSLKEAFSSEKTSLEESINTDNNRVLSKEEIMSLGVVDRARMLDKQNRKKFSAEQRKVLNALEKELRIKDPSILNKIREQSVLQRHRDANASAYSMMLVNPRAAEAQWRAKHNQAIISTLNSLHQRRAEYLNNQIARMENNPEMTPEQIGATLYDTFIQLSPATLNYFNNLGPKSNRTARISHYKNELERAIEWTTMTTNIARAIQQMGLNNAEQRLLQQSIDNIINNANNAKDAIEAIRNAASSEAVNEADRNKLSDVLRRIDKAINTDAATVKETKAEATSRKNEQRTTEEREHKATEEVKKQELQKEETQQTKDEYEVTDESPVSLEEEPNSEESNAKADVSTEQPNPEVGPNTEQVNSPTIEEQVADANKDSHNSDIIEITPDITDGGNKLPEPSSENMLGNALYRYDANILKDSGLLEERSGKAPGDSMNRYFDWFKSAGIRLQDIIDRELRHIIKVNPKIEFLHVNPKENATDDAALKNYVLLCVEYTDKVAKKHKDSRGGVVDANGKKYLIVGTLGFNPGNKPQMQSFNNLKNRSKTNSEKYFTDNPSERFFVDPTCYTEIEQIGSGRLVRQAPLEGEEVVPGKKVSELLADESSNPDKLELEDLKWMIQYETKAATVNVSERNVIHTPTDAIGNKGNTFILVEGANGEYSPIYILPTRLSEIEEGELKKEIDSLIAKLSSTNHAERLEGVTSLMHWIYLDDSNNILIGTQDKTTVTIRKKGIDQHKFDVAAPDFDAQKLLQAVYELDPRINITIANLQSKTSLRWLDEAGALKTDVAILGTSNASYTVSAIDENGTPIKTNTIEVNQPSIGVSSDLAKANRKLNEREMFGQKRYTLKDGQWVDDNGNLVKETNPTLDFNLTWNHYIRENGLEASLKRGRFEYFIIDGNTSSPTVLQRNINTKDISMLPNENANRIIETVRQEQLQKEREEAARKANEEQEKLWKANPEYIAEGEEVVEGLTEEQLIEQEVGEAINASQENNVESSISKEESIVQNHNNTDTDIGSVDNSNKSLSALQQRDVPRDIDGLMGDRRYFDRIFDALANKGFRGGTMEEVKAFLKEKDMPITNIDNIDVWIDNLENCR